MVAFVIIIYLERKFGILYIFIFGSYTENIWITIRNIFKMCMDMYAFFNTVYAEFIRIMYGLTMTFLLLL